MKKISFEIEIFYNQIVVFNSNMENPFNDWNDIHVNQGFTWREGSVAFGTLYNYEDCEINVILNEEIKIEDDIIRAIVVPFKVDECGIEIGSIMETVLFDIPKGNYELLFTIKNQDNKQSYNFTFVKNDSPIAKVIKADDELNVPKQLLMKADVIV